MKHLNQISFFIFLAVLTGCGDERTVDITFHEEPNQSPEINVPTPKAPTPAVAPQGIPDSVSIEAQLSDVNLDSKKTRKNKWRSVAKFTLSLAQFSGGFPDALDLSHAESFSFRSKYDKGCDKSSFRFSALSPHEASHNEFVVEEPEFDADCNQLFGNIKKDMRVDFTNVPLVKDPSKVVASVSLHMIP